MTSRCVNCGRETITRPDGVPVHKATRLQLCTALGLKVATPAPDPAKEPAE